MMMMMMIIVVVVEKMGMIRFYVCMLWYQGLYIQPLYRVAHQKHYVNFWNLPNC